MDRPEDVGSEWRSLEDGSEHLLADKSTWETEKSLQGGANCAAKLWYHHPRHIVPLGHHSNEL